jgi:hypothetical protein
MSSFKISSITNLQHLFNSGLLLGVPIQYTTPLLNNNSIFYNSALGVWENGVGGSGGGVSMPDGSVTNPGLFFASETDTGIYKIATRDMGFTVGGLEVFQAIQTTTNRPKVLVGNNESPNSSTVAPFFQIGTNTLFNRVYDAGSGSTKTFTMTLSPNSIMPLGEYSPCVFQINITTGTRNTTDTQIIGSKRVTIGFIRQDNNTASTSTILEDINSGTYPSMTFNTAALVNGFSVSITTPSTGIAMKNVISINYVGGELFLENITES